MPVCLNRVLHFFTHFRETLSTDDYLSEHEIWPEFDPAKSLRVRRIVQSYEYWYLLFVAPALMFRPMQTARQMEVHVFRAAYYLLFVAPALMFRPMQTARQIEVHVFRAAYLQKIRLVEDIGIVVLAQAAIRNIDRKSTRLNSSH